MFKGAEVNYSTAEKEMISVIPYIMKFRSFSISNLLAIITNNKSITYINNCKLLNTRMRRRVLLIEEYDITLVHCKDKENV